MDTLTHTLTGAVIARAIDDKKVGRWGMVAGLVMGAFPDSDFILGLFNRQFFLQYHRDFTHSILLIPFYAILFSWLFVKISKRPQFWSFYKICISVLLSHVLLDLLTSYGTMIFSPFFEHRFAWDLVFIIDLIFSGIIFVPLLASLFLKRRAQWVCRGSLIGLATYILFCWVQHGQALKEVRNFSEGLKEEVIQVAALPQPISPFRWALYVETKANVYQGFLDLTRKDSPEPVSPRSSFFSRLDSLYYPSGNIPFQSWEKLPDSPWVKKALALEGIKFFYWFARFPVVKSVNLRDGVHRVEFMDVRFFLPGIRLPFVYYVELDDQGLVLSEGFVEDRRRL
ncbi:MAG: metal-dependent hydrolase [Deltaproteobacteria bacterium]|nr:metal-dependent hydrolase [Deltaproteobacteria bacterium]